MMNYQNYGCQCQQQPPQYYSGGPIGDVITEGASSYRMMIMAPILIIGAIILAVGIIAIAKRAKESREV